MGLALLLLLEVNSLQNTVDRFRSDLSSVKVQVSNTQSSLTSQIRNTIYAVLSEEAQLLSTFQWNGCAGPTRWHASPLCTVTSTCL